MRSTNKSIVLTFEYSGDEIISTRLYDPTSGRFTGGHSPFVLGILDTLVKWVGLGKGDRTFVEGKPDPADRALLEDLAKVFGPAGYTLPDNLTSAEPTSDDTDRDQDTPAPQPATETGKTLTVAQRLDRVERLCEKLSSRPRGTRRQPL